MFQLVLQIERHPACCVVVFTKWNSLVWESDSFVIRRIQAQAHLTICQEYCWCTKISFNYKFLEFHEIFPDLLRRRWKLEDTQMEQNNQNSNNWSKKKEVDLGVVQVRRKKECNNGFKIRMFSLGRKQITMR